MKTAEDERARRRQAVIRVGRDGSTLRARLLGGRLREQRAAQGLTLVQVAKRVRRTASSVSRWESGEQVPRPGDLLYLLVEVYGVAAPERDELMRLAEQALEPASESVSIEAADYDWLERQASRLETFSETVIPGLLQTEAYVRAILKAWDPTATKERLERLLRTRIARQERLTDTRPLQLAAVITEAALWAAIGGREARREQLRHLLDRAALRNVELRVIPYSAGAHPGFAGSFSILRFDGMTESDLARVGTRGGDVYFEDAEHFAPTFRRIKAAALSPRESVDMIAGVYRETA